ncbi:MAG: tetratricopeptide repeat protein [Phycisphaerales bacterium]|nr:tetratricopeptide repeat protein [Phycisphaerales bacterium]
MLVETCAEIVGEIWIADGRVCGLNDDLHYALTMANKGRVPGKSPINNAMTLAQQYHAQGALDKALSLYEQVLSIQPNHGDALCWLGVLRFQSGDSQNAIELLRRSTECRPAQAKFFYNLGKVHHTIGDIPEAITAYQRAIDIDPRQPQAHCNLANAQQMLGHLDEALKQFERAMVACPTSPILRTMYLCALNYLPSPDRQAIFAAHKKFGDLFEAPLRPQASVANANQHSDAQTGAATPRPLRIGYVSPDFKQHSVAHFIEPVLTAHDKSKFEVFCYSNNFMSDEVTERIKSQCAHWRVIANQSDEVVAQQIRDDGIDILVDLAGHTPENRLMVFARKPAPVQVTWLGYPNTTGLTSMDYRITDALADPVGETESFHSEKLLRLPECFSCFEPPRESPKVGALPALAAGHMTFGSFNNAQKMTPQVIALWSNILKRVPQSRLMLKYQGLDSPFMSALLREQFSKHGIERDRLDILGKDISQHDHMNRYNQIDIGLDPFPYNGTTTTCDALWMGVPVITLAGINHVGRVGVSQMENLGLPELIARDGDDYVQIAARLAGDLEKLAAMRADLRERMMRSPLTNVARFTRYLEAAYQDMWRNHVNSPMA